MTVLWPALANYWIVEPLTERYSHTRKALHISSYLFILSCEPIHLQYSTGPICKKPSSDRFFASHFTCSNSASCVKSWANSKRYLRLLWILEVVWWYVSSTSFCWYQKNIVLTWRHFLSTNKFNWFPVISPRRALKSIQTEHFGIQKQMIKNSYAK